MHAHHNVGHLTVHLRSILGEEGFVRLCDELGGLRVYMPAKRLSETHELVAAIGREAAEAVCEALSPATIRVPLARRDRALYWRRAGWTDRRIAHKLGITETGLSKLFAREGVLPRTPRRRTSPAQLDLL